MMPDARPGFEKPGNVVASTAGQNRPTETGVPLIYELFCGSCGILFTMFRAEVFVKIAVLILGLLIWPQFTNAAVPQARAHHAGVYDSATGETLIYGGYVYDPSAPNRAKSVGDLWAWNGKAWRFVADTGQTQVAPGMAYDSKRDRVLMFSSDDEGTLNYLLKGHWTVLSADKSLARVGAGMTYDARRDQVVLFGGRRGQVQLADTWQYDEKGWAPTWMAGPSLRDPTAVAYDSGRGVTVLYGGFRPLAGLDDTWEWDGMTWKLSPSTGPGARAWPGIAYDSKRQRLILFSGEGKDGKFLADTWSYDGRGWKTVATAGPPPRIQFVMTYDERRDRVVLFGGMDAQGNYRNDVWEFDGTRWVQVSP